MRSKGSFLSLLLLPLFMIRSFLLIIPFSVLLKKLHCTLTWKSRPRMYCMKISKFGFKGQHTCLEIWQRLMCIYTVPNNWASNQSYFKLKFCPYYLLCFQVQSPWVAFSYGLRLTINQQGRCCIIWIIACRQKMMSLFQKAWVAIQNKAEKDSTK